MKIKIRIIDFLLLIKKASFLDDNKNGFILHDSDF